MTGPDPNKVYPNENIRQVVFIKNVVKRANILVGDYTYYDDPDGAEKFEEHVTHHYDFLGDRLVIGKFCAIARGIEFVMNGANHRMRSVTTYPFNIMGGGWEKVLAKIEGLAVQGRYGRGKRCVDRAERDGDAGRSHRRRGDYRGEFSCGEGRSSVLRRGRKFVPGNPKKVRRRADGISSELKMVGLGRREDFPQYGSPV